MSRLSPFFDQLFFSSKRLEASKISESDEQKNSSLLRSQNNIDTLNYCGEKKVRYSDAFLMRFFTLVSLADTRERSRANEKSKKKKAESQKDVRLLLLLRRRRRFKASSVHARRGCKAQHAGKELDLRGRFRLRRDEVCKVPSGRESVHRSRRRHGFHERVL